MITYAVFGVIYFVYYQATYYLFKRNIGAGSVIMKNIKILLPVVFLTILLSGCQNTGSGIGNDTGTQDTQINASDQADEKTKAVGADVLSPIDGVTMEAVIDFEWLYGKLKPGRYQIAKTVTDFRGTGDYTNYVYATEFDI